MQCFTDASLESHSFAPTVIVRILELNGDRTIGIDWLFACPGDRLERTGSHLKLGGEIEFARVFLGKQKGSLPQTAPVRMPRIESSSQAEFSVRALELKPEHSRNACHSAIVDAHDHFESVVAFALPDP